MEVKEKYQELEDKYANLRDLL